MMDGVFAFIGSPTFWVLVSFVIFVAVAGGRLWRFALGSLDRRAERIVGDLETARQLRSEAEALHREEVARADASAREAAAIVAEARETAHLIREDALAQLRARLRQAAQLR